MKTWVSVIVALISLVGTVIVAVIQSGKAEESTVQVIVDQINDKVIPRLQESDDKTQEDIAKLRERVAALEALEALSKVVHQPTGLTLIPLSDKPKTKPAPVPRIPRVQMD